MTIHRRLFISNILMVLVPVILSLAINSVSIGLVWYVVEHGTNSGFEDTEDFSGASKKLVNKVVASIDSDPNDYSDIAKQLRRRRLTLVITKDGAPFYSYGEETAQDSQLFAAIAQLYGDDILISQGGRNLYVRQYGPYLIRMYGSNSQLTNGGLMLLTIILGALLALGTWFSIFITDRFLMRFVFRRIQEPIDLLGEGVRQIQSGNLAWRIAYDQNDEFLPVCTAFNHMAERLELSVKKTAQDEESRKELLAGISHDLRSPLTSIQAYVEGLLDGIADTDETRRAYLLTIRSKAQDINGLVNQLFLFSKIEMDDYPIHPKRLYLDELVRSLVAENREEYRRRHLLLAPGRLDHVPVSVDPGEFLRVFANVAGNSVKYRTREEGRLAITVERKGNQAELVMADDGPGVDEADLGQIFDVFYRSDPSRRNPHKGSGLGLAIAQRLIQRMGGGIHAENVPTGGLALIIDFPIAPEGGSSCNAS